MFFRLKFANAGYEYFEYRTYLPVIGIFLIFGLMISKLSANVSFKKMLIVAIPLLFVYSVIAYIHSADFADPFAFFTSAIKTNPNNAMVLEERGIAYYYKGIMDKAMSDFDSSIRVCPTYPPPYFNKGMIYTSSNDHYKAEYFFSQALKYDTLSKDLIRFKEEAIESIAHEKYLLRKYDESKSILKKVIMIYPNNSRLHNYLGLAFYCTSKFDSALYEYNKAIELEKNIFSYYDSRGMAEYHLKDFIGALNDFNRALDLNPDFRDSWGSRGMTKIELKDYEGAIYDLTKVISMKHDLGAAWYYRGLSYFKLNKQAEAKDNMNKALELGYKGRAYGEQD